MKALRTIALVVLVNTAAGCLPELKQRIGA
jgi:hypothetical protein